jgi:glycosyltransferase involved in cell wall biosynthesis
MNIKLSICIPTHNRINKLIELISIFNSINNPRIEVLISDDSTNDDTENYFSSNIFEGIKYFRNYTNLGQFKNCNACIARAKGEWIQILHDDDDIDISYLNEILPFLDDRELVIITGNSEIIELSKNQGVAIAHQKKLAEFGITYNKPIKGFDFKQRILKYGNPLVFSHTIFRKEVAISHGGFDTNLKFIGDLDLWLKLLKSGDLLFLNNKFGSYYLHGDNQLSTVDTFIQQSIELMVLRAEMLVLEESEATNNYVELLNGYIGENIQKTLFLSSMIKNKNIYAQISHLKLCNFLKNYKYILKSKWTPSMLFFKWAYLISEFFPEKSFNIYSYFKVNR